jgi:hypothetical protein
MRILKILIGTAVAIAMAVSLWWLFSYEPSDFRGAAPMRDTGVFSYPRYHATLGDVPLFEAEHYTLRFSGLPSEHMTLQLHVVGESDTNRDLLVDLTTELSAYIVDSQNNVLCSAAGTPSNPDRSARWVLMSSGFDAAFWHVHCRDVPFARHTDYMLHLSISDVDPRSPKVLLRATLKGGGIELP